MSPFTDQKLPRQQGGHHLAAPALRVGIRNKISLQFSLRLEQAIEGDRGSDRLSGRHDPKLLGEALADPPRSRRPRPHDERRHSGRWLGETSPRREA